MGAVAPCQPSSGSLRALLSARQFASPLAGIIDVLLWPARVVTPQATYDPCHFRDENGLAEILDKAGAVIATLSDVNRSLAAEGAGIGSVPEVTQIWHVELGESRWLIEFPSGCGCGGTRTTGTNLTELAW